MRSSSSKTEPPSDTVAVGRILRPRGLRGELIVHPLSSVAERFDAGSRLWLAGRDGAKREVEIESARPHPDGLVVRFVGVADRNGADAMQGGLLEVDRRDVAPAEPGSYYEFELLGSRCIDARAGELGVLEELLNDGGGQLMRIVGPEGSLLVPFVERFLRRVDVAAKTVELDLPEGLVEACRSPS